MKKHPDQELIIIKQKLFLLALSTIENQNLIKYHGEISFHRVQRLHSVNMITKDFSQV
jgi:hypothetical protein